MTYSFLQFFFETITTISEIREHLKRFWLTIFMGTIQKIKGKYFL
jgi:hypothetical protein